MQSPTLIPQQLRFAAFCVHAHAVALRHHGRDWEVYFQGKSLGYADGSSAENALRQVHRGEVNNALYANDGDAPDWLARPLPTADVLAEYPELIRVFPHAASLVNASIVSALAA